MPVSVRKVKGKWRVVEKGAGLAKNSSGTPVDGGGHQSQEAALRQARAINSNKK